MSIGAAGDDGDHASATEIGTFLDRPLHAVELENGEKQSYLDFGGRGNYFVQIKVHAVVGDGDDSSAANSFPGGDVKFLPETGAQDSDQMIRVVASEGRVVARDFVGYPAAARHGWKLQRLKAQFNRALFDMPEGAVNYPLPENVLHFAEQRSHHGLIIDLRRGLEFLQQLFLSFRQLGGNLHAHFDVEIAFAMTIQHRDSLISNAECSTGLRSIGNFEM